LLQAPADQVEPAAPAARGPLDPTGEAEAPPAAEAPAVAPGAGPAAVPAVEAPSAPPAAPAASPTTAGDDGSPADDTDDPEVGPPGAPTVVLTPGGQGARVLYVSPSWEQPDLNGGELVEYHVVITDANGVVLRDETTRDRTVPRYEGERCVAPYTVEVTAITRTPGADQTWTGPTGTATVGRGCPVVMEIDGGLSSAEEVVVQLREVGVFDPYVSVKCDLLSNGAVVWSGYCGSSNQEGEEGEYVGFGGLEPDTEYEIVLRVQQFVGGPTTSNTITVTTPAA
jgi:hypothetical protein